MFECLIFHPVSKQEHQPRFLPVGGTLTLWLHWSSLSSALSCLVRLSFQCSLHPEIIFHCASRRWKSLSLKSSGSCRGGIRPVQYEGWNHDSVADQRTELKGELYDIRQIKLSYSARFKRGSKLPKTWNCRSVSLTVGKLWISEFRGSQSVYFVLGVFCRRTRTLIRPVWLS